MEDLFTSQGIWKLGVIIAGAVLALLGLIRNPRFGLVFLAAMLFVSSLGLTEAADKSTEVRTWLYGLQQRRQLAYALFAGLLFLSAFIHSSQLNSRNLSGQGFMVMLMGIYMGMITIFHEGAMAGVQAVVFAVFSMSAILIMLAAQLRTWDDIVVVLRSLVVAGAVITLACVVQFQVNQSILTDGNMRRFVGLSGNPQHAAGLSAVMVTMGIWLALNDRSKLWKLIAIFAASTHIIFCLWTASRTGLALMVIGVTGVLFARLGRAVLVGPILAAAGFGLLSLATSMGVQFGFERLVSKDDTRTDKWWSLWETGKASPVIGVGLTDAGGSENGFLYGFASFGVGVPVIMLVIMFASMYMCARLVRARFETDSPVGKRLIDITITFFVMYWLGNLFEGFGVARISPQLTFFLVYSAISSAILTIVRAESSAPALFEEYEEQYEGYGQQEAA